MGIEQAVISNLRVLPREQQQQVLSFIQSLQQTDAPALHALSIAIAEKILPSLQRIQDCWGEPTAVIYADNLLQDIRTLRKQFPFSPLVEILSALHDAMAFQNRWVDYTATQYRSVCDLLLDLSARESFGRSRCGRGDRYPRKFGF